MLYDRWREVAAQRANQLALTDLGSDRRWTFAELAAAAGNSSYPIEEVVFPTGNAADFVLAVLRGWRCGAVVCPVESGQRLDTADWQALLTRLLPKSLRGHEPAGARGAPSPPLEERVGESWPINTNVGELQRVQRDPSLQPSALGRGEGDTAPPADQLPQSASDQLPPCGALGRLTLPPNVVHLKITSATGGVPRLVAFAASQLAADARNIVDTMSLRPDWPNLGVISLAHSYGFSNLVLPLLLHGIPLVLVGGALPELVRRAARVAPEVTLAAVPILWQNWQDADAIPENVRLAISAGAPLPLTLEQNVFDRHRLKIHNFYGSSECGGIAYDLSDEPRREAAYAGTPLHGVEIVPGEEGCLEVRGQAVGLTYWPEPSGALAEGVFRTSDLGEVVGGKVYLRGRAGDQINVAGRKVAPEAIEQALASHPQVRGCLAFGVPSPDPQRGEIIVACVVVEREVSSQSLKQLAMDKLPAWQVPREWWMVDSLEVNGRGKLSRSAWRSKYLEEKHKKPEGFTPR